MSVLQRKELEESPLADLHAIASELAIEGYRTLRKDDLIAAILGEEAPESPGAEVQSPDSGPQASAPGPGSPVPGPADTDPSPEPASAEAAPAEPEPQGEPQGEAVAGVLDIISNGSGFIRMGGPAADDVYVSPAQIRRCELRAGDEVAGPLRPARRNERHPSLVRVEQVNGRDAEPPEIRPHFDDLTPVHPTERLPAPESLEAVPFGKGSRVALAGGPGAGASRLLRELVSTLATDGGDLSLSVVLVGVRPEEVTDWWRETDVPVTGSSFYRPLDSQARAAELAVERAKRVAERGGDAVVVIDSLESLPAEVSRRVFGAGRKLEEGGSVTVLAASGMSLEAQRQASTRIGLDPPQKEGERQLSAARSGTQRADLLA